MTAIKMILNGVPIWNVKFMSVIKLILTGVPVSNVKLMTTIKMILTGEPIWILSNQCEALQKLHC